MDFELRHAKVTEATALSELAGRSKANWPYDQSYLVLCRSVTHITPDDIMKWPGAYFIFRKYPSREGDGLDQNIDRV